MEGSYFNINRGSHVILLAFLEKEFVKKGDKVEMYKFGDSTQHLFINGKYTMTLNWSLI